MPGLAREIVGETRAPKGWQTAERHLVRGKAGTICLVKKLVLWFPWKNVGKFRFGRSFSWRDGLISYLFNVDWFVVKLILLLDKKKSFEMSQQKTDHPQGQRSYVILSKHALMSLQAKFQINCIQSSFSTDCKIASESNFNKFNKLQYTTADGEFMISTNTNL